MTRQARFVMSAFFRLSENEKREVANTIEYYMGTAIPLRENMVEDISVVFDPPPFGCPICRG